jgi:hypothetical protein
LNTGLIGTALDWLPNVDEQIQFMAIGGTESFSNTLREGQKQEQMLGYIQIWKMDVNDSVLILTIQHPFGDTIDLKWCPNVTFSHENVLIDLINNHRRDWAS